MIKALEIENFKGIGERIRIEFAPITLLFGPNSAGKSTVLKALAYLNHLFKRGDIDARQTEIWGDNFDLGGYQNLLHRHDPEREISFSLEFSEPVVFGQIRGRSMPRNISFEGARLSVNLRIKNLTNSTFTVSFDGIEAGVLSFRPTGFDPGGGVVVERLNWFHPRFLFSKEILDERVPRINRERHNRGQQEISVRHYAVAGNDQPELYEVFEGEKSISRAPSIADKSLRDLSAMAEIISTVFDDSVVEPDGTIIGFGLDDEAFAPFWRDRGVVPVPISDRQLGFSTSKFDSDFGRYLESDEDRFRENPALLAEERQEIVNAISIIFAGTAEFVRWHLNMFFLGPLRRIPTRVESIFRPELQPSLAGQSASMGLWSDLASPYWLDATTEIVNRWLSDPDGLDLGVAIKVSSYFLVNKKSKLGENLNLENFWEFLGLSLSPPRELPDSYKRSWGYRELEKFGSSLSRQKEIRLLDTRTQTEVLPEDLGVGVSQVLPLVVQAIGHGSGGSITGVEQPELHLHPKAQLALGDLFIATRFRPDEHDLDEHDEDGSKLEFDPPDSMWRHPSESDRPDGHLWLIETHSEHILLRVLRRIRLTCADEPKSGDFALRPEELAVNYIETGTDGTSARRLHVDENGDFRGDWPKGFFEERNKELF